ncbi:hypothetical protein PRIPAC_77196 [Pristionchus pacificus]|uniref:ShK domain-containing protein n=1 Tax=Pristionchus pacificus TaxID=54126 RepID=A0A2A6CM88_PRIPA|nr:hypothetical protein PRIPAC_77196 [Pristionchus pacificus]|eukprot:PDM79197.1 ShK domain-containing protein [Pristionchus pacificus]
MHFLLLAALPALAAAIADYPTCDGDATKLCFETADCGTSGFTGAVACNSAANTPVPAGGANPGCCEGGSADATTTTTAATTVASATTTLASTTCVDLLNPLTGVSDCPARASLCANSVYLDVMRVQCPRTCGFCTTSSGTSTNSTSTTSCVDLVNPNTRVSDCPNMKIYCDNAIYKPLMTVQCPATCGFCISG